MFWGLLVCSSLVLVTLTSGELLERAIQRGGFKMSAANTSFIFLVLTFMATFMRALLTLLNFTIVEGIPSDDMQSGKDLFGRYEFATRVVVIPLLGSFSLLAMMNTCLMWIDIRCVLYIFIQL
jgi:hypothetical protein